MKDRIPLYPGRVKLTAVDGQPGVYDMVRADDATEQGTPLSKATLLDDDTAALFGLTGDAATVNNALAKGNKDTAGIWNNAQSDEDTYLYTWQATQYSAEENTLTPGALVLCSSTSSQTTVTWEYGDDYTLDAQGHFHIVDPQSIVIGNQSYLSSYNVLRGKWCLKRGSDTMVYFIVSNAVGTSWSDDYGEDETEYSVGYPVWDSKYSNNYNNKHIKSTVTQTPIDPVTSYDSDAYPNGGFSADGSIYYSNRSQVAAAKIPMVQSGTYVGTGKYGQSNLNSITFDKKPKFVFIGSPVPTYSLVFLQGAIGNVGAKYVYAAWEDKTLSWYGSNAEGQCNKLNTTYTYYYIY